VIYNYFRWKSVASIFISMHMSK